MTEVEEALLELDGLFWAIALERTAGQPWLTEDTYQEARIAAWQRLEEGHSKGIATYKARQAATDVVRGRRMTGSKTAGGQPDAHRHSRSIFRDDDEGGYVLEPADPAADAAYGAVEAREVLRGPLTTLSASDREVLWAYHGQGLTSAEIAAQRGITPQGIRVKLKRAHEKMRKEVAA